MAFLVILAAPLFILVCGAHDNIDTRNNTNSKLIEWGKPLSFNHILDSKDVQGKVFGGIILTACIIGGLLVMSGVILVCSLAKDRCGKSDKNYNRLYDKNIISVQNDVQKV